MMSRSSQILASIFNAPPSSIAWIAFRKILTKTCAIWFLSTSTGGSSMEIFLTTLDSVFSDLVIKKREGFSMRELKSVWRTFKVRAPGIFQKICYRLLNSFDPILHEIRDIPSVFRGWDSLFEMVNAVQDPPSGLLISWATPEVSFPMATIFSVRRRFPLGPFSALFVLLNPF